MNNITGTPVIGDNFFGREKELEYAWQFIKAGITSICLLPEGLEKPRLH